MDKKTVIYIVIVVLFGIGTFFSMQSKPKNAPAPAPIIQADEKQNVENYLRANISKLSPVEPVLGGTWYVVAVTVDLEKKSGTVTYEDGHIQEKSDFTYAIDARGEVTGLTIIAEVKKSGVNGVVTMGPTCPVEKTPPDPACGPKPYSTSIFIRKAGSTEVFKTVTSDAKGEFSAELAAGKYTLQTPGGNIFPRCSEITFEVKNGQYTKADISCDTGIR